MFDQLGPKLRQISARGGLVRRLLGNFGTAPELAGFSGGNFPGRVPCNFSATFGWLGSPCHSRLVQGRRHRNVGHAPCTLAFLSHRSGARSVQTLGIPTARTASVSSPLILTNALPSSCACGARAGGSSERDRPMPATRARASGVSICSVGAPEGQPGPGAAQRAGRRVRAAAATSARGFPFVRPQPSPLALRRYISGFASSLDARGADVWRSGVHRGSVLRGARRARHSCAYVGRGEEGR